MTRLLLALLILLAVSCTKQEEFDKILSEAGDTVVVKAEAQTESSMEMADYAEEESDETSWPRYYDGKYFWTVEYIIHTNDHHPNGYVIITKISKNIDSEKEVWTIDYTPNYYIEEIHYNLKAKHNGGYEEENVFLPSNEDFKIAFRTAEAIYIAWVSQSRENPVTGSSLIDARNRMEGRQHGLSIEY